ncbi:hypothetical protein H8959_016813 [Pygathrix nigripes]
MADFYKEFLSKNFQKHMYYNRTVIPMGYRFSSPGSAYLLWALLLMTASLK